MRLHPLDTDFKIHILFLENSLTYTQYIRHANCADIEQIHPYVVCLGLYSLQRLIEAGNTMKWLGFFQYFQCENDL